MAGPLAGVRILDLSTYVAGPMAACMLADQGAEVIKIEDPGNPDQSRIIGGRSGGLASLHTMVNRGKKAMSIDLRNETGREILLKLAASSDVVLENFRPGVMKRLKLDYDALSASNPEIIYASITGFGDDGPYASRRVFDSVIQSTMGLADAQMTKDGEPMLMNTYVADKVSALTAAQAITSALFARTQGRGGQKLTLSMMEATLFFMWPDMMWNYTFTAEDASTLPPLRDSYYLLACNDGHIVALPSNRAQREGALRALGKGDQLETEEYQTRDGQRDVARRYRAIAEQASRKWKRDELCARLEAEEVPHGKVQGPEEILADPQIQFQGSVLTTPHPMGGDIQLPKPAADFHGSKSALPGLAPLIGEHTAELLLEIGLGEDEIQLLMDKKIVL